MIKKLINARDRYLEKIQLARRDAIQLGLSKTMVEDYVSRIAAESAVGYLYEIVKVRSDIVCRNDVGFVSNYDNSHKIIKEKGIDGISNFRYVENNKKIEIFTQYKNARAMASEILELSEPILGYHNIFNSKVFPSANITMINEINQRARKTLDCCVEKGYQEPAMELIRLMSDKQSEPTLYNTSILTTLNVEELKNYLRRLVVNYAKKSMYQDKSSFFDMYIGYIDDCSNADIIASKLAERETNPECLYKMINAGKFGDVLDSAFVDELKDIYHLTLKSMKNSAKAQRLAELRQFEEDCCM